MTAMRATRAATMAIALGANLPADERARVRTLERALRVLAEEPSIEILKRSRWYRSPAWSPIPESGPAPNFINAAALLASPLPPAAVLESLHRVEKRFGRTRDRRWEPRTCDLDLLFADDCILPDRETCARWMTLDLGRAQTVAPACLVLPHPRLRERAFALVPLAELAPDWRHPLTGRTVEAMLRELPPAEVRQITPLKDRPPPVRPPS